MDGKIYDLLQQIQDALKEKNARIGLSRNIRESIFRLAMDSDYYDEVINAVGVDDLTQKLQIVLDNIKPINEKLDSFASSSDESISKSHEALLDGDVISMEDRKDELLRQLIRDEVEQKNIKKQELKDKNRYSSLISEFKK